HWKAHRTDCKAEQTQVRSATAENARLYNAFKEWTRKHSIMLKMAGQYALIPSANTPQEQGLLLESHIFRVVVSSIQGVAPSDQFEVVMAMAEPISYLQALYKSRPEEYGKQMQRKKEALEEVNPVTREKEYAGVMFIVVECPCSQPGTPTFVDVVPAAIRPDIVESIKNKTFDGDFSLFLQAGVDGKTRVYADESQMLIVRNAPQKSKLSEAKKSKRNRRGPKLDSSTSEPSSTK
ncbi:hypothetical protein FRC00_009559, partial [Tulasnella sp. 408]